MYVKPYTHAYTKKCVHTQTHTESMVVLCGFVTQLTAKTKYPNILLVLLEKNCAVFSLCLQKELYNYTAQKSNTCSLCIWLHRYNLFVNLHVQIACDCTQDNKSKKKIIIIIYSSSCTQYY